jgi:hypothetical protein
MIEPETNIIEYSPPLQATEGPPPGFPEKMTVGDPFDLPVPIEWSATPPRRLRASSAWLYEKCPAAYWLGLDCPDVTIAGSPAEAGTLKHAAIVRAVMHGDDDAIPEGLLGYVKWLRNFVRDGYTLEFEQSFEISINGWILEGHPDTVARFEGHTVIPDYKSGRVEVDGPDDNLQTDLYALLVARAESVWSDILTVIYQPWAEEAYRARTTPHDQESLNMVWDRVVVITDRIESSPTTYNPGGHCAYCKALKRCPEMAPAIRMSAEAAPVSLFDATPEQRGEVAARVRMAEAWVTQIKAALRKFVETTGEPIRVGNDELGFVASEEDKVIIDHEMLCLLHDLFGNRYIEALKSSKSALQDLAVQAEQARYEAAGGISETRKRGWIGAAQKKIIDDLRAMGAIVKKPVTKFEWHKVGPKINRAVLAAGSKARRKLITKGNEND